jgi:hypothetical protein
VLLESNKTGHLYGWEERGIVVAQIFSEVPNRIEFTTGPQKVDDVKGLCRDFDHMGTGRGVGSEGLNHHWWRAWIGWRENRYKDRKTGLHGKKQRT